MKLLVLLLVALPAIAQTPGVEPEKVIIISPAEQQMIMNMLNELSETNSLMKRRLVNCLSRFET